MKINDGRHVGWREVIQNVIYKINNVEDFSTRNKEVMVVNLTDALGMNMKAFVLSQYRQPCN